MDVTFSDMDDFDRAPVRSAAASNKFSETVEIQCQSCAGTGERRYGYTHVKLYPCGVCRGTGKVNAKRLLNISRAKKSRVH